MLNRLPLLAAAALWMCLAGRECSSFCIPQRTIAPRSTVQLAAHDGVSSRREWAKKAFSSVLATGTIAALGSSSPEAANADDKDIIWKTGKAPIVPGQKPKDKNDTKGTRKDPSFLRSVSDCKGQCENSPGPDGLARSSAECLSACQDICCTTYEQCTFAIVPR